MLLALVGRLFTLHQPELPEAIDGEAGPAIGRAVDLAPGGGFAGIDAGSTQRRGDVRSKIDGRGDFAPLIGRRIAKADRLRVQTQSRGRRPAIQLIAQHRKPTRGGLHADLMGATGLRHGLHGAQVAVGRSGPQVERGHCDGRLRRRRRDDVALTGARDATLHAQFAIGHRPVGQQHVALADLLALELLRQALRRAPRLRKQQHAGGVLVEPVHDGEVGPARLAMPQPVVDALPRIRIRRVRVPAGGLAHREHVLVLVQHAGRRGRHHAGVAFRRRSAASARARS